MERYGVVMIILNIIILMIYIIFWVISRNYENAMVQNLDEKLYRLKKFYPIGLYFMDKLWARGYFDKSNKRSSKLDDPLKALFAGKQLDVIKRLYLCNKVVIVLLIIFLTNLCSFGSNLKASYNTQLIKGRYIERPGFHEGTKKITLDVNVSEEESTVLEEEVVLEVEEERYDKKEWEKMVTYAKEYIDLGILNNNQSAESIQTNFNFVSLIPETGLAVKWQTSDHELVDEKGRLHNENIKEGVLISVTAVITYYNNMAEYTRYFRILPKEYSAVELARKRLSEAIDGMEKQSKSDDMVTLPDSLEEQRVVWAIKKDNSGTLILLMGILTALLLYTAMDQDLMDKVKKRNREMLLDYPEIINKFTLLVGAGMSLSNAWCKISQDYKEKNARKRYAYEEMIITYGELMIGTSETTAYERFGRRVKLLPYLRFSSLISQNVIKGSAGILSQLELEVVEAFEERKELAKRMGEEAGTKLLVPMMLMLLIVLAIIMVPAFLSFSL